ncbi:MAG: ATP-grasp domain-containing protein [Candidatus Chisholmbacteria bacterium]|nr:ATP-grasp domain-containing protein [Candidatus Chisholmbacteria bacterium]
MPLSNTNSRILLQAAKSLGITAQIINYPNEKIKLTKGQKSHIVHKKGINLNLHSAIILTRNKAKTLDLLRHHGLPIPKIYDLKSNISFPLVVKPISGQKGQHVYLNIQNQNQLDTALTHISGPVLTQQFIPGHDLRFLILAGKVIGIVNRRLPRITGDGHSTIKQLLNQENTRRVKLTQKIGRRMLNRLRHWPRINWYLKLQSLTLNSILPKAKTIAVYPLANFSTGASAHALAKNQIHPSLIRLAEQTVKLTRLKVAGVDMIVKDWTKPATPNNAYIIEINSDPSLRLHDWPNTGHPQHVAQKLLTYIFSS